MNVLRLILLLLVILNASITLAAVDVNPVEQTRYETAREAQFAGQWQKAIDSYAQLKDPLLKAVGEVYAAECLWRAGNLDDAWKRLDAFLQQDTGQPSSPYRTLRGEALLLHARVVLEAPASDATLKTIIADTEQIDQWAKAQTSRVDPPSTPGQLAPAFVGVHDIILPQTATWYVPVIQEQARLLHAYALLESQNTEAAANVLAEVAAHPTPWSTLSPTKIADLQQRVTKGACVLPASGRALLTGEDGQRLKLAFFMLAIERPDAAEPIFQVVHARNAEGKGSADFWAASEIGLAACNLIMNRHEQALQRLELFDGLLRASGLADHGRLIYANVLVAGDKKSYNYAMRTYNDLSQSKHADVAKAATQCMAIAAEDRGDDMARNKAAAKLKEMANPRGKRRSNEPEPIAPPSRPTAIPAVSNLVIQEAAARPIWLPQAPMQN